MDFGSLLDAIVPILFLVLWVVSGIIQASKNKEDKAPGSKRKRRSRRAPSPYQQPQTIPRDPIEEIFGQEIARELQKEEQQQEALYRAEQMVQQAKVSTPVVKQERNYVAELEAQRQKAKEALAFKDATMDKHSNQGAYALSRDAYSQDQIPQGQSLRQSVKASLRHNRAAKRAFLMHEILGAPIALREQGKMGKSWQL